MGPRLYLVIFKCRCNNYKLILLLAVIDALIAILEDLNLKFSRGSMAPDPLVCSRLRVRILHGLKWENKGLFTWKWGAPRRGGNPLRWSNLPVHIISRFNLITFTR